VRLRLERNRISGAVLGGALIAMLLPAGIGHAAFGQEVLRYGTTDHQDVKVLQLKLRDLGYNVSVDGVFGTVTLAAVEAFQRAHGLPVTGVVANLTFRTFGALAHVASRGSDPRGSLYVVQSGDTLSSIAASQGVPLAALESANPSAVAGALQIGQTLVIPSASAVAADVPAPSTFGAELAAIAPKYLGVRYVFGGSAPSVGFDCSGLVWYLGQVLGVNLPRTSSAQYDVGTPIPENELQPGDLVFFDTEGYASHVGIYMGNDEFIQAETWGTVTHYSNLSDPYWANTYLGARRIYGN